MRVTLFVLSSAAAITAMLGCGSTDMTPGFTSVDGDAGGVPAGGAGAGGDDGTGGGAAGSGGSGGGRGVPGALCRPIAACDAAPPDPGPPLDWEDAASYVVVATGAPNHRGRDLYLNPGDPQWAIGKFSYGLIDKDLKGERVDVYLLRDCGDSWELLGSATTTQEDEHPDVEGVSDTGGRIYLQIPPDKALGPGRHRVHMVVRGDLSTTDAFIEIVPRGAPMFVSDVDGTLTGTETEEFTALLTGDLPTVHPDAAEAFGKLVSKGYRPMYLTARPEWLVARTRAFVDANGFPPGVVHTTLGLTGATSDSAAAYKTTELDAVASKGMTPAWAFGNTATDAAAYENAGVAPLDQRVFYQFDDTAFGGRRIERYSELLAEIESLPDLCD